LGPIPLGQTGPLY